MEVTKVEHKNIYAALSAFQGENPVLKRTKEFGKDGDKMHFWYCPLDEVLQTIRPLLAKHGLSFVHREFGVGMVCELYHETYENKQDGTIKASHSKSGDAQDLRETETPHFVETGVIRSMPIVVKRSGDMKIVGTDSTYARRYTLAETLGIAPDEDNDVKDMEERTAKLEGQVMRQAKKNIETADDKKLTENAEFVEKEMKLLADGKKSALGLNVEQLEELRALIVKRRGELGPKKPAPGENTEGKDIT